MVVWRDPRPARRPGSGAPGAGARAGHDSGRTTALVERDSAGGQDRSGHVHRDGRASRRSGRGISAATLRPAVRVVAAGRVTARRLDRLSGVPGVRRPAPGWAVHLALGRLRYRGAVRSTVRPPFTNVEPVVLAAGVAGVPLGRRAAPLAAGGRGGLVSSLARGRPGDQPGGRRGARRGAAAAACCRQSGTAVQYRADHRRADFRRVATGVDGARPAGQGSAADESANAGDARLHWRRLVLLLLTLPLLLDTAAAVLDGGFEELRRLLADWARLRERCRRAARPRPRGHRERRLRVHPGRLRQGRLRRGRLRPRAPAVVRGGGRCPHRAAQRTAPAHRSGERTGAPFTGVDGRAGAALRSYRPGVAGLFARRHDRRDGAPLSGGSGTAAVPEPAALVPTAFGYVARLALP